ncbi:hypothetical protein VTI74DRAFT_4631 [Chaetomium olivicolor]
MHWASSSSGPETASEVTLDRAACHSSQNPNLGLFQGPQSPPRGPADASEQVKVVYSQPSRCNTVHGRLHFLSPASRSPHRISSGSLPNRLSLRSRTGVPEVCSASPRVGTAPQNAAPHAPVQPYQQLGGGPTPLELPKLCPNCYDRAHPSRIDLSELETPGSCVGPRPGRSLACRKGYSTVPFPIL